MKRFGQTQLTTTLGSAAFGLVLVLLLWPSSASAAMERCLSVPLPDMAERDTTTWTFSDVSQPEDAASETNATRHESLSAPVSEPQDDEAPCTSDADADPSSNFCFEDAEGQISTLPRLLAQWRGEQAADTVINSMLAAMETADTEPRAEMMSASVEFEPVPDAPDENSCTTNPDECRSLPPLPPTLNVDVTAPGASQDLLALDVPTRLSEDTTRAWADLRVGPQLGHRDPPEQPPRG